MTKTDSTCEQVALLRLASRELVRELGFLEAKNPYAEATGPQIHALIEINNSGDATVAELARVLNLNQSTTCRTLAEMRKLGWVETVQTLSDRKRKPVQLTAMGKEKLDQINTACGSVYRAALDRLPAKDRALIVEGFTKYVQALKAVRQEAAAT